MSAFNEVLEAEKEAEQAIDKAKTDATAELSLAESKHKDRVIATKVELQQAEISAVTAKERELESAKAEIAKSVTIKISVLQKRFQEKKVHLLDLINQSFK